jgi:Cd2+/Zn2+-exporting ATPase
MIARAQEYRFHITEVWLMMVLTGLCLVGLIVGLVIDKLSGSGAVSLTLFVISYLSGGLFPAREAYEAARERQLDVNVLMIAAAIGAAAIGFWEEGATLMFLFSLSGTLETYAMVRTRRAVQALMELRPETALVDRDGSQVEIPIDDLVLGDIIILRPGDRIPVDGTVLDGDSTVDESSVTGEAIPVDKCPGDHVYASTLNQLGVLNIRATTTAADSTLAQIVRAVEEAEEARPRAQRIAERLGPVYTIVVIAIAIAVLLVTRLAFAFDWQDAVYRSMTVLVVASPCAVMIPIPAAILSAIAGAARRGIVFKGGDRLETAGSIKVVAFDKTGTLTIGRPVVVEVRCLNGESEEDILALAASVEQHSEHPLARAVVVEAEDRGLSLQDADNFSADPGWGVTARIDDERIWVGKGVPDWALESTSMPADGYETFRESGYSTLMVGGERRGPVGLIALSDRVRDGAALAVAELHSLGIRSVMLSGDSPAVAQAIARETHIEEFHADLLPDQKLRLVGELRARYGPVAMVGDGINDAPALAAADLGLAMGLAGTDVALETGDVVLTADELDRIPLALDLGRRATSVVRQNLIWAISVISILLIGALGGWLTLTLAVLGHEGSTLIGVLNGLRLLRTRRPGISSNQPGE